MSNQGVMVVATKYRLTQPVSMKEGTWNKKSGKEKIHTKIVSRAFVEDRNSHENNELYVIDEQATIEMQEKRNANINSKNGVETKKVPMADDTITHVLTKKDVEKNPSLSENGLKEGDEVQLDGEGNVLIKS